MKTKKRIIRKNTGWNSNIKSGWLIVNETGCVIASGFLTYKLAREYLENNPE